MCVCVCVSACVHVYAYALCVGICVNVYVYKCGRQQLRQRQVHSQRSRCAHAQEVPPPNSVTIRFFHFLLLFQTIISTLVIEDKFHRIQHRPREVLGGLATLALAAAEVLYRAFALGDVGFAIIYGEV